jgi:hypothetical protein
MNKLLVRVLLAAALLFAGVAIAQKPVTNVNPAHHPNIAAAERLTEMAYEKIVAAQQANEFDMNGHAQKAKELLDEADQQLKLAAGAANKAHP